MENLHAKQEEAPESAKLNNSPEETVQRIQAKIDDLQKQLKEIKGSETEVYTRIVGYHRAVASWNKGKKEEYKERIPFKFEQNTSPADEKTHSTSTNSYDNSGQKTQATSKEVVSYLSFYSPTCQACPAVKKLLETCSLKGEQIDVSSQPGYAKAVTHNILSTPTVLFLNSNGTVVSAVRSLAELKEALGLIEALNETKSLISV